ncbi:interferon-induced very large GTPase 1-like [Pleurodeles waltl]
MSDDNDHTGKQGMEDSGRQQLEKILSDEGLDVQYWLPKLKELLGVTSAHAMKHLSQEDYLKLEPHVKQPWQQRAFRKILKIPDNKVTLKKLQDERLELMKKNQEQAKLALKDLKEMQTLGKSQDDEGIKKKLEDLRKAMSIPENSWPSSSQPLIEIIESLHKEVQLTESSLLVRENLDDEEVLKWASGGRILQGIYKTNKLEDVLKKRDHLISAPENFSLFGPEHGPVFQKKEFSSYSSEKLFTKVMESRGFTVNCKAKAGFMGFSFEGTSDCSIISESQQTKKSLAEHNFICTTKYNYIPLASCFFQNHQIRLSTAALSELTEIEKILGLTTEQDKVQVLNTRFGNFFTKFGSHADTGPFHLGGIYWWKASSEGFKTEDMEEVKRIATQTLDTYVGASYCGFGLSAGVSVGVSSSYSKSSFNSKSTESIEKNIQLSVTKTGGPVEADSLVQWKSGLMASNKTWSVIDTGFNLVPVWDIILQCHRNDFKDVYQIGTCLAEAYKAITKQDVHLLFGEGIISAAEEAQAFLQDLESWEVTCAVEQLKKIICFKQELNEKNKDYTTWIRMCLSNKALPDFLAKVVKTYENVPTTESAYIKAQMHCLLNSDVYSCEIAPVYSPIIKWMYLSEEEQKQISISHFYEFIDVLEREKRSIEEAKFNFSSHQSEAVHDAQIKATFTISSSLYSIFKVLRASEQPDIEFLLLSYVVPLGYSLESGYFQHLLGCSEIDFMINNMQDAHKTFLCLKKNSASRAQAFLLLTSLTLRIDFKDVSVRQKKECFDFMIGQIKGFLSQDVSDVVDKYIECNDFKSLEEDLLNIRLGHCKSKSGMMHKESLIKELNEISLRANQVDISVSETEDHYPTVANTCAAIQTNYFSDLIRNLGLERYYPQKMTPEHVHVIDHFTLQISENQPSTDNELPFYFLQKLMIMDYRARDLTSKSEDIAGQGYVTISEEIHPPSEPLNIMGRIFGVSGEIHKKTIANRSLVHPMDVQMAIYHCADDFLRQWISTKLSVCQFALPLLVPNPCTSAIEFPLWSFRQVSKNWQQTKKWEMGKENTYIEKSISGVSTPIVSFFRIGKSAHSKSQLMNSLLNKHNCNIFFHRNCLGGNKNSVLMAGLAEIFWYCPSGNKDDRFDQCIAFTNLHGDAIQYMKQAVFLENISSLNVVFMSYYDKEAQENQFLNNLLTSPKPSICLCNDIENNHPVVSGNKVMVGLRNRNEAELVGELKTFIIKLLATSTHTCKLEDCASVARKHGFHVDEDRKECREGKALARTLMSHIGDTPVTDVKEMFLPLQGSLWHKWCEKDKELTRLRNKGNRSIEQHRSDIESEKKAIRRTQVLKAQPINRLMEALIQTLQTSSAKTKRFFLHWLKVFLDDLFCDQLTDLRQQYLELKSKKDTEKNKDHDLNNEVEDCLETLSKKINASMFGLEHLLREVGQIYEALDAGMDMLPQIAADLMANGFPVELMDGDASYVPLKWIVAVLDELIKNIGDKKLVVLSVLGVQSSGKSTLLNTMFGLQFAVSAGRCTRGAFMQLVKIDEKLGKDYGFDYILVVDTEGLQSIERENKSALNFDNELATFVIGLGNMTLINVYGENASQIQDILQIVVQAFLRMKQVKLSPRCLFVHQNVGHLSAQDKNMKARECLQKKLDEMAKTAAQQELCEVIRFSDVIKFDANEHIHYFSHLWEGNPPMAPLNPNYSQNVQDLRNQILMIAKKESKSKLLSISQLKNRIEDLWRALLNENFVFSFKNTLEISAYNKLEKKLNAWTWQLRSHMLNLQIKYNNRIKNGSINHIEKKHLEEEFQEPHGGIFKDLEVYFNEGTDCEILVQWRASVEKQLQVLKQELIDELKNKSEELIRYKNSQSKLELKKSEYEENLFKKSKHLALRLKNKALDEEQLKDNFKCLWIQWVTELSSSVPHTEDPNIMVDVENVLISHFHEVPNLVDRFKDISKRKAFSLDVSKHIQIHKYLYLIPKSFTENDKSYINQITGRIVQSTHEYIETKRKQKMAYNRSYIHEIVNEIKKVSSASQGPNFKFTAEYQIDLSLYLCNIASIEFIKIHKEFQKSNDPVAYLESKREGFFNYFKISCQGTTSITTFADCLCNKLKEAVQQAIYDSVPLKIADSMRSDYPAFNENKAQFEKHILISLAEKEDFEQYRQYIHFPEDYYKTFIKARVEEHWLNAKKSRLKTILNITLDFFQNLIVLAIGETTQVVKDKHGNAALWLDELCRKLGDNLNISRGDLKVIEHQEITNLEFLKEALSKTWKSRVECLRMSFAEISLGSFDVKPHLILAKQLCGCMEQCPFCKAICTNTISGHDGDHCVHFHRPQAVSGIQWYETDHLVTDICSSLVASDCMCILSESNQFPYKNYKQAGPPYSNWSIKHDNSSQAYWKWFVCHFQSTLERDYLGRFEGKGVIPQAWTEITKDSAISELKQL